MLHIAGREKDLGGGLKVRRILPAAACRSVGPFVFLDHFGPLDHEPGMNFDVRPHPHIGLATVTYLLEGAMMHRDSLGSVQRIEPGAINWMSAGRGIVHSERTPEDLREVRHRVHGLQLWVGLPQSAEQSAPSFSHSAAAELAAFDEQGIEVRLLIGEAFGRRSPVPAASPTLFLSLRFPAEGEFSLPALAEELAVYPLDRPLDIDGQTLNERTLGVLGANETCTLKSGGTATVIVVGGAPLDGPRYLWWNFVSSQQSRIEEAAQAWRGQRFGSVPGESQFIPLPDQPPQF